MSVFQPSVFQPSVFQVTATATVTPAVVIAPGHASDTYIECWVTEPDGTYIAHLDRSQASPFRRFAVSRMRGADPGAGSLEYHRDNDLLAATPTLFDDGNLVWMRFNGRTLVWVVEEQKVVLDQQEHATDWTQVSGRGVKQLLADRIVWPTEFDETHLDPSVWGLGGYSTKVWPDYRWVLDGTAASGQKVVPLASTTGAVAGMSVYIGSSGGNHETRTIDTVSAGVSVTLTANLTHTYSAGVYLVSLPRSADAGQSVVPVASTVGAVVGIPVRLTGGGNRELGIIASIDAGVSITLEDDLAHTFRMGSRVMGATQQWRRFVNRACGEMLWDLIDESNARGFTPLVRGTIETDGADGWTQDFRFDNLLDVVKAVTDAYGDVDMDGLTFNYRSAPGTDRSASVIFEEGADVLRVERATSDRDTLSWIVAEGVGEGSTATLRVSEDATIPRRREGYLDAKDAGNLPLVQLRADSAISEHQPIDSIALEVTDGRFAAFTDFDVDDTVRVIAPSRGIDASAVIVGMYLAETDDERIRVGIDVNSPRQEYLLSLEQGQRSTASSVGVRNRQPQGALVPFSFSGADVFDDTDTMDVLVYIPDRISIVTEARAFLRFRQYFTSAKSATSGGGSTSGSSSASSSGASSDSTSGEEGSHDHGFAYVGAAGGFTTRRYAGRDGAGNGNDVDLVTEQADSIWTTLNENHSHSMLHSHGIAHSHSTPDHAHSLTYGVYKETMPASHSVTLKVYYWDDDAAWDLVTTISGITDDVSDQDLTLYITGAGVWRLELKSAAAQPNGGRLGCDVAGFVLGAIQSE
jgi:hypothetical protein